MSNQEQIRILVTAPLRVGGVSSMMIHIQQHLDRNKINFDYLVYHDRKEPQEDTVLALGSRKLIASGDDIKFRPFRRLVRMCRITKLCRNEKIDILHINSANAFELTNIIAARLGGVKHITIHSHNAGYGKTNKWIVRASELVKPLLPCFCDTFWSCSDLAARFMFPKSVIESGNYQVILNGIELDKYDYNEAVRERVRRELGIEHNYVIGHAGRFTEQKNHAYLIDIFKEVAQRDDSAILLLFGNGELQETVRKKVTAMGLEKKVRFMGISDRMAEMLQAMDIFVMPSLHEGLPVAGIEAQASGLPCLFSDQITREVGLTDAVEFIPIQTPAIEWVDHVLAYKNITRVSGVQKLRDAHYDIQQTADLVSDFYLKVKSEL